MSFREEDRDKESNSSRGLGLGLAAAAAIGVGVGAALYYFINKRTENPTTEGSTTRDWTCESPHTLNAHEESIFNSDDTFTTISEHSTTDTSIFEDSSCKCMHYHHDESDEDSSESESPYSLSSTDTSISDNQSDSDSEEDNTDSVTSEANTESDWDVSASSDYPSFEPPDRMSYFEIHARNLIGSLHKDKRNNELNKRREEAFRERSWSLEECSICFDVILRDQEVMSLPCTHNFHTKCIVPWLQEQQTCPNCRKSID